MNFSELSRRIENIIRFGTIAEVDLAARRVRVQSGELLTDWLKWRTDRAGSTRTWNPPTIGEQVMILSPSGELGNGIVMPSIYSDAHDAPSDSADEHVTLYPDDARLSYNHVTQVLNIAGIKDLTISATGNVNISNDGNAVLNTAGNVEVMAGGKITHTGNTIDLDGGGAVKGCVQGDCLCSFTGMPHPQVSATVKASA
jgi:phage baseplate assembly protein V